MCLTTQLVQGMCLTTQLVQAFASQRSWCRACAAADDLCHCSQLHACAAKCASALGAACARRIPRACSRIYASALKASTVSSKHARLHASTHIQIRSHTHMHAHIHVCMHLRKHAHTRMRVGPVQDSPPSRRSTLDLLGSCTALAGAERPVAVHKSRIWLRTWASKRVLASLHGTPLSVLSNPLAAHSRTMRLPRSSAPPKV